MAALPIDLLRIQAAASWTASHSAGRRNRWKALLVWLMPVTFAVGFVLLLGSGNPILESWLAKIDLAALLSRLSVGRVLFWVLALVFVWALLRPRSHRHRARERKTAAPKPMEAQAPDPWDIRVAVTAEAWRFGSSASQVFGVAAILRALVLFNLVFALQTGLDAVYLWGGLELPEGVTYAAYAHRGAHTLIFTALLAAAFVLVAMRPGTQAARDPRICALVYLWTGQTLALVLSAMLRLDLYVEAYALTALRLAAFLWMGLVAVGLVLILARIALERSNPWLIKANLLAVALLLFGYGLADTTAFVARFNVEHSREVAGYGSTLDVQHLEWLGPAALPAIDRALVVFGATRPPEDAAFECLRQSRLDLAATHEALMKDWRNWSFRGWRLSRYLDSHPAPVPPAPAAPALPPRDGAP